MSRAKRAGSDQQTAIKAAMAVAKDVAEGRLAAAELGSAAADECRQMFGTVAGRGDPLWPVHVEIARQVLGLGGIGADELSEWLAVARRRADETPQRPSEPPEGSTGTGYPSQTPTAASEAHSPQNAGSQDDDDPEDSP